MPNNFEINLDAASLLPDATNGPEFGVVQNRLYAAYDDTTKETAYSGELVCPAAYTGSGTLKADIYYIMASATSGTVEWEVAVEAITDADAVDLDSASSFDTVNTGSATVPGTAGYLDVISVTLANKDGIAAGDLFRISVARVAADTANGDARILAILIREEA